MIESPTRFGALPRRSARGLTRSSPEQQPGITGHDGALPTNVRSNALDQSPTSASARSRWCRRRPPAANNAAVQLSASLGDIERQSQPFPERSEQGQGTGGVAVLLSRLLHICSRVIRLQHRSCRGKRVRSFCRIRAEWRRAPSIDVTSHCSLSPAVRRRIRSRRGAVTYAGHADDRRLNLDSPVGRVVEAEPMLPPDKWRSTSGAGELCCCRSSSRASGTICWIIPELIRRKRMEIRGAVVMYSRGHRDASSSRPPPTG